MRRRRAPLSGDGRPCIVGGAAACLRRAVGNRVRSRQRRRCCCDCRSPRPAVYGGRWGIECAAVNVGGAAAIVNLPTGLLFTAGGGESKRSPTGNAVSETLLPVWGWRREIEGSVCGSRCFAFPLACCLRRAVGNREHSTMQTSSQKSTCFVLGHNGKTRACVYMFKMF